MRRSLPASTSTSTSTSTSSTPPPPPPPLCTKPSRARLSASAVPSSTRRSLLASSLASSTSRPSLTAVVVSPVLRVTAARDRHVVSRTVKTNSLSPLSTPTFSPSSTPSSTPSPSRSRRLAQMRNLRVAPTSPAMGLDHSNTPRKPVLAAASARPGHRTPLTPKIAASATRTATTTPSLAHTAAPSPHLPHVHSPHVHTPHSPHAMALATPLARRSSRGSPVTASPASSRDDLAGSVTPRSGSRQSRVDGGGYTSPGSGGGSSSGGDAKFFYASDAAQPPSQQPPQTQQPPLLYRQTSPPLAPTPGLASARASAFFYANGRAVPDVPPLAPNNTPTYGPAATATATPPPDISTKFLHANGAAIDRPHPPAKGLARAATAAYVVSPQSRPMSPAKVGGGGVGVPLQKTASFPASPRATTPAATGTAASVRSRHSIGSGSSAGHSRHGSLTMADPPAVARLLQPTTYAKSENASPATAHFPPGTAPGTPVLAAPSPFSVFAFPPPGSVQTTATSLASILQAADELSDGEDGDGPENGDGDVTGADGDAALPSPSAPDAPPPLDDLVVTARRERKVQDLEITNASLEAINRSLERQLRKQKTELRQFRRLSRSGRLSLAPSAADGMRSASTATVEGPLQDPARVFAGLSDDEDDDDDDDEHAFADATEWAHGAADPTDQDGPPVQDPAAGGAAAALPDTSGSGSATDDETDDESDTHPHRHHHRRTRDERRLQLDLAKHRQMLLDGQKINQSIKRCLSWTDTLIAEGRKALAFQVRVSEIQLGGRVLVADELEADGDAEDAEVDLEADGDDDDALALLVPKVRPSVAERTVRFSEGPGAGTDGRKEETDKAVPSEDVEKPNELPDAPRVVQTEDIKTDSSAQADGATNNSTAVQADDTTDAVQNTETAGIGPDTETTPETALDPDPRRHNTSLGRLTAAA